MELQKDKQALARLKRVNLNRISPGLSGQFLEFLAHLIGLQLEDAPDYEILAGLLSSVSECTDADRNRVLAPARRVGRWRSLPRNARSVIGSSSVRGTG
jgi:hypothetical protein